MIHSNCSTCHHITWRSFIFMINSSTAEINFSSIYCSQCSIFTSLNLITCSIINIYNRTISRSKSSHTAYFNFSILYIYSSTFCRTFQGFCVQCCQPCNIFKFIRFRICVYRRNITININSSFVSCKPYYWLIVYCCCSYSFRWSSGIYNTFVISHIGYSFFWSKYNWCKYINFWWFTL